MNQYKTDIEQFAQDLYDLMGRNGIKSSTFFNKYVLEDGAFQIDFFENEAEIQLDNITITIKRK